MSTKRDSASIKSGEEHKRQKMNDDAASVKQHETGMEDYLVRNNMLPSIITYLPPRDILNCIQTSKKWKKAIDTDCVWKDTILPSLMFHLPPRDILQCIQASQKWKDKIEAVDTFWEKVVFHLPPRGIQKCIQASKKWKDKIDTVDKFWQKVVNISVPPKILDVIEEQASKLPSSSSKVKYTMNYEKIALAFDSPYFVDIIEEMVSICVLMSDCISRAIHNYKMIDLEFRDIYGADLKFLYPGIPAMELICYEYM